MEQTAKRPHEKPKKDAESEGESDDGNGLQIPDGGWGWVVCFAGFMINSITQGIISSTGIILLGLIDLYDDTISKTSMVASLFHGIMMCVGPFVLLVMMFNASHRQVIMFGGFFSAVSTIASVFAQQIEVLWVTFGIFSGGFIGISYFAANTIVGSYFKKKRTLAVGISSSGRGCGIFALNYLTERSISFYGMRGTFLLMSGLLLNFLVFGALCRPLKIVKKKNKNIRGNKLKPLKMIQSEINSGFESDENKTENKQDENISNSENSEKLGHSENGSENDSSKNTTKKTANKCSYLLLTIFNLEVLKKPGMQLLLIIYFFWAAIQIVIMYIPTKVVSVGLSREQGALIISIYGAVFAFSNIIVGIFADLLHIPTSYLLTFSLLGMSVISIAITFCHSFSSFVICISLYAICEGFSTSLRVVLVASVLGVQNLNKGYSHMCLLIGLAYIIHPIIAGALYDNIQSFDAIYYYATACFCMASIVSTGIIYMQLKKKFEE